MNRSKSIRKGLTLIEVVAAMALAGTLLVLVIRASTRNQQKHAQSVQSLDAMRLTDQLIASWISQPEGIPHHDNGSLSETLSWTTFPVGPISDLQIATKIRLTVFELRKDTQRKLFSLDLIDRVETDDISMSPTR